MVLIEWTKFINKFMKAGQKQIVEDTDIQGF